MNELEDVRHFSAIRVGDAWFYNGVDGDAFRFGGKPRLPNVRSAPVLPRQPQGTGRLLPTPSSSENFRPPPLQLEPYREKSDGGPRSAELTTSPASSSRFWSMSYKLGPPVGFERSRPASTPPKTLPPILPPPPAAHLPPALPSRPPSSLPSRSASPASSSSSRKSSLPHDEGSPDPALGDSSDTYPTVSSPSFYRSSGTITVEASPRVFGRRPSDSSTSSLPGGASPTSSPSPSSTPPSLSTKSTKRRSSSSSSRFKLPPPSFSSPSLSSSTTTKAVALTSSSSKSKTMTTNKKSERSRAASTSRLPPGGASSRDSDTAYETASDSSTSEGHVDEVTDPGTLMPAGRLSLFQKLRKNKKSEGRLRDGRNPGPPTQTGRATGGPIPPEIDSIRKRSVSVADVITSALVVYKANKAVINAKKMKHVRPRLEKAANCRRCHRHFGLRCFRYHCSRCKKSFCDRCIPITRYDSEDVQDASSSLTRVCALCTEELAVENSRGQHRGLWSEFQKMRAEGRDNKGLDVTSSTGHKQQLDNQTIIDLVPKLRGVCFKFLMELGQQLHSKSHRNTFIANYLQFESPVTLQKRTKGMKEKQCRNCNRQMRMLTEIRDCAVCHQSYCKLCTYRTLQLYLVADTDLTGDITIEMIQFHVKGDETDEVNRIEASETYYMCSECEDLVLRNMLILEFNLKVPELEAELFDLQRQIDHALSFSPYLSDMHRSVSAMNVASEKGSDVMGENVKLANRLYDRYIRTYDVLERLQPQTPGQKALHRHIKQAMYDFYCKRRDQLKSTLRTRGSCTDLSPGPP